MNDFASVIEHIEKSQHCDYEVEILGRKYCPLNKQYVEMSIGIDKFYLDKGIYLFTLNGEVVYVGVTLVSYRRRMRSYFSDLKHNINRRKRTEPIQFDGVIFFYNGDTKLSDVRLLIMELELIEMFNPKHNTIGRIIKKVD